MDKTRIILGRGDARFTSFGCLVVVGLNLISSTCCGVPYLKPCRIGRAVHCGLTGRDEIWKSALRHPEHMDETTGERGCGKPGRQIQSDDF